MITEPPLEETFADLRPEPEDEYLAALRAEGYERRRRMCQEPAMAALRARAIATGPPDMGVAATADPVADVRVMMAAASFRRSFDTYEWFDLALLHDRKLVELRHSGCLECPCDDDGDCCDAACQCQVDLVPLRDWRAQRDFLNRRGIRRYLLSVHIWQEIPTPDEAFQVTAAAGFWPGVHVVHGIRPVPFILADGSLQEHPGLQQPGGWWGVPSQADGQPVPETLADRLVSLVGWRGSKAALAREAGFGEGIQRFNAELKRIGPELRARCVAVIRTGRRAGAKGGEEFSVVVLAKSSSDSSGSSHQAELPRSPGSSSGSSVITRRELH